VASGHTGSDPPPSDFTESTAFLRSVTVSINLQRTQKSTGTGAVVFRALREAEELAVCAALAG
jgi:hypothetical protein